MSKVTTLSVAANVTSDLDNAILKASELAELLTEAEYAKQDYKNRLLDFKLNPRKALMVATKLPDISPRLLMDLARQLCDQIAFKRMTGED